MAGARNGRPGRRRRPRHAVQGDLSARRRRILDLGVGASRLEKPRSELALFLLGGCVCQIAGAPAGVDLVELADRTVDVVQAVLVGIAGPRVQELEPGPREHRLFDPVLEPRLSGLEDDPVLSLEGAEDGHDAYRNVCWSSARVVEHAGQRGMVRMRCVITSMRLHSTRSTR